jgi:hypothetical protein
VDHLLVSPRKGVGALVRKRLASARWRSRLVESHLLQAAISNWKEASMLKVCKRLVISFILFVCGVLTGMWILRSVPQSLADIEINMRTCTFTYKPLPWRELIHH